MFLVKLKWPNNKIGGSHVPLRNSNMAAGNQWEELELTLDLSKSFFFLLNLETLFAPPFLWPGGGGEGVISNIQYEC